MVDYIIPDKHARHWLNYAQSGQGQYPSALTDRVLQMLPEGAKNLTVLDAGSGAGSNTIAFASDPRVAKVYAVDAVARTGDILYARAAGLGAPIAEKIQFLPKALENIERGSLPRVDIAFVVATMPYIHPDKMADVTGMLLDMVYDGGIYAGHFATPDSVATAHEWNDIPVTAVDRAELAKWLRSFGFDDVITDINFDGAPAKPGEPILMYEVVQPRRRLRRPIPRLKSAHTKA
jgi:SAM-dependent methyltransferase